MHHERLTDQPLSSPTPGLFSPSLCAIFDPESILILMPTLDIQFYPHLFDEIVGYVHAADDISTLSALRAAGRASKAIVDGLLASHMVVSGAHPCTRYYQVWSEQWARGNRDVRAIDVFPYDDESTGQGTCASFLRNCKPHYLRLYGQRSVPFAPSLRALIKVMSYSAPLEYRPFLLPCAHNVMVLDAHVAASLQFFDIEPCGKAHLTLSLSSFFAAGPDLGPRDRAVVFSTLNNVVRWAEDQLELYPGLTIAFLGLERRKRGFAYQSTWQAVHDDRMIAWASEIVFDMHVDYAERMSFLSHSSFRAKVGDEMYRLVVDT